MKKFTKYFILSLIIFAGACDGVWTEKFDVYDIRVDKHNIHAEVAISTKQRSRGLMYRGELPENDGMLFIFPETKKQNFWMKNTLIPLDIAFFDEQGFLIEFFTMDVDNGKKIYSSSENAKYGLEMNAGWFRARGIKKFDRLHLPDSLIKY